MTRYDAHGPVRGSCGHEHTTVRGAWRCAERDMRDVRRGHPDAYSDRRVRRLDGRPLTDDERDELDALEGLRDDR